MKIFLDFSQTNAILYQVSAAVAVCGRFVDNFCCGRLFWKLCKNGEKIFTHGVDKLAAGTADLLFFNSLALMC